MNFKSLINITLSNILKYHLLSCQEKKLGKIRFKEEEATFWKKNFEKKKFEKKKFWKKNFEKKNLKKKIWKNKF